MQPRLGRSLHNRSSSQRSSRGTPRNSRPRRNRRPPCRCTPLLPAPPGRYLSPVPRMRSSPRCRKPKRPGARSDSRNSSPDKSMDPPTGNKCPHKRGRHRGRTLRRSTVRRSHHRPRRRRGCRRFPVPRRRRSRRHRRQDCRPCPLLRRIRARRQLCSRRPCLPCPRRQSSRHLNPRRRPYQPRPCQQPRQRSFHSFPLPRPLGRRQGSTYSSLHRRTPVRKRRSRQHCIQRSKTVVVA